MSEPLVTQAAPKSARMSVGTGLEVSDHAAHMMRGDDDDGGRPRRTTASLRLIRGGAGNGPADSDASAASAMIDDEPTPIDPPSFDLAALDNEAAAQPARATQPGDQAQPFGNRLPRDQERFLNYIVLGKHAEGGLSLIYELAHVMTRERLALKILKPERRNDAMHVKRLTAEGQLLMSIKHDNLCPVVDGGTHPELGPYLVMPMLRGHTLGEYLRSENAKGRSLSIKVALDIVITVAEVLQLMHQQGAYNRDLKPDNIFLVRHDNGTITVKVIDWGASKTGFSPRSTQAPSVLTPLYMAPEQADPLRYKGEITGATDQWALAIITMELIADHPWRELLRRGGLGLKELIAMILQAPLPRPPLHQVPQALTDVLVRATAKQPSERYGSMTQFADALRGFLESGWKLGARPAALDRAERATRLTERAKEHARGLPRPAPRKRPASPPAPARRVPLEEACARATLLVLHPAELRGQRFELGATGTIGRHAAYASLVLDHESVSNEHVEYACVQHDGERPIYSFENLTPANPVFLADNAVEGGPWAPQQVLELGEVRMVLMPACAIAPDLTSFTPISNAAALDANATAASASGASERRKRRLVPEHDDCSRPTLMILVPEALRGKRFELGARGIIGRVPDVADIVVDDGSVSASHLEYTLVKSGSARTDETVYQLRDLASSNGSYLVVGDLNDGPLEHKKLERGYANAMDRIRLGDSVAILLPPGRPDGHIDRWVYPGETEEEHARAEAAIAAARRARVLKRWDDARRFSAELKKPKAAQTSSAEQTLASATAVGEVEPDLSRRRATMRYVVAAVVVLALLFMAASIIAAHQRGIL